MKLHIWTGANPQDLKKVAKEPLQRTQVPYKLTAYLAPIEGKDGMVVPLPTTQPGDVVLGMGLKCVKSFQALGLMPKNKGLGKLRETPIDLGNDVQGLVTYDPGIIHQDWARIPEIQWDINLAARLVKTGSMDAKLGSYIWVGCFTDFIQDVIKRYGKEGKPVPVSCDLETMGLDPFALDKFILTIGFSSGPNTGQVLYFDGHEYPQKGSVLWNQISWLLTTPKIRLVGANLKFDYLWILRHLGIRILNWRADSVIMGSLQDENRGNSLELHTKIFLPELGGYDAALNQTYDKGKMEDVPKEDLLPYAGGDLDAGLQVAKHLANFMVKDDRLANFYINLLQPATEVFAKMENRGMYVDAAQYEVLRKDCKKEIAEKHAAAIAILPARLQSKYSDNLSLSRAVIIKDFLFTPYGLNLKPTMFSEKTEEPSTAKAHLDEFIHHPDAHEFISAFQDWTSASKILSTYIVGFLKHLRADGMFHPSYMMHRGDYGGRGDAGTVTGRTSAKDPAYQTIPKHNPKWAKKLRRVYIAPPGYVVMNVDFSQGELRLMACVAQEQAMIQAYLNGIDMHLLTGITLHNLLPDTEMITLEKALELKAVGDPLVKSIRQGGKAGNFGLIYGMQAPGFMNYAWTTYQVKITLDQSFAFRDGFFGQYPGIPGYHEKAIEFAKTQGYVRNPLGRIRHLPLIHSKDWGVRSQSERQAINSPIQSGLSDLAQLAMVQLDRRWPGIRMFGFTHDAISLYVPANAVDQAIPEIKEVMENLPLHQFGWKPALPFPVDFEVGPNMGDLKEV